MPGQLARAGKFLMLLPILLSLVGRSATSIRAATIAFAGEELLCRPTGSSITINVVPDEEIELYYEYGTSSGVYTAQTSATTAAAGEPSNVTLNGLAPNTRYYYRMQYRTPGEEQSPRTLPGRDSECDNVPS